MEKTAKTVRGCSVPLYFFYVMLASYAMYDVVDGALCRCKQTSCQTHSNSLPNLAVQHSSWWIRDDVVDCKTLSSDRMDEAAPDPLAGFDPLHCVYLYWSAIVYYGIQVENTWRRISYGW